MTAVLGERWVDVRRALFTAVAVLAVLATACGASDDSAGEDPAEGESTTTAASADVTSFGDLESPCGDGDASVAPDEGPSTDALVIGVPNDRGAGAIGRPGLNKELWDASQAYAQWCNDQGGIQGLPIELVELDGKAVEVEAAMTQACTGVFALVGGGFVQDQLEFSGRPESDFHQCGLIDVPAFAVSIDKSLSNGKVEPIPNPSNAGATQWVEDFVELYPEESSEMMVVTGDLPSFESVQRLFEAAADREGVELLDPAVYPFAGAEDWAPYADRVIDSGATSIYFIGAPDNATSLLRKLREKGWEGISLHQTNAYDQVVLETGADAAEGMVVRTAFHPFEEADRWPAVQQYLDLLGEVPDGKVASLGLQSMSAWLLFSVAANACADANDGVIDRTCVLTEAAAVDEWTAGGLHAPADPGSDEPPTCGMLMTVRDGEFQRLWPELDTDADDLDGFSCPEDGIVTVDVSDLGEGQVDPDRPI